MAKYLVDCTISIQVEVEVKGKVLDIHDLAGDLAGQKIRQQLKSADFDWQFFDNHEVYNELGEQLEEA